MLRSLRSVAICLILLCGITHLLEAQTDPALTPGNVFYLKERVAVTTQSGVVVQFEVEIPVRSSILSAWLKKSPI